MYLFTCISISIYRLTSIYLYLFMYLHLSKISTNICMCLQFSSSTISSNFISQCNCNIAKNREVCTFYPDFLSERIISTIELISCMHTRYMSVNVNIFMNRNCFFPDIYVHQSIPFFLAYSIFVSELKYLSFCLHMYISN